MIECICASVQVLHDQISSGKKDDEDGITPLKNCVSQSWKVELGLVP